MAEAEDFQHSGKTNNFLRRAKQAHNVTHQEVNFLVVKICLINECKKLSISKDVFQGTEAAIFKRTLISR